nr:LapA family protein [uncultured Noviherbaspirillum sp.]
MKVRTVLLFLVLLAIVLFAALNWAVFTTPATLSLLVATVEAPLGLIMLGLLVLLTGVFAIFAGYQQTSTLLEARQQAKRLEAQRKLADQAEASRITELQNLLNSALQRLEQQSVEGRQATIARLDQMEQNLRAAVSQEGTTLSAYIGELEDRLDRQNPVAGVPPQRGA